MECRRTRIVRFATRFITPFGCMAVFTAAGLVGQAQQQNPGLPPNSTPGTATANAAQPAVYKVDRHQIVLSPTQGIEYKYQMQKGTTMVYSWKTTGGKVHHEFHGEPEGAPRGYADTYLKEDETDQSHGTFVAPSTGIHGWYWENRGQQDVTVNITAAGFFGRAFTLSKAGRVPRELPDADSAPAR